VLLIRLNDIFPWLSIRNKLLIAFAGLSVLPLALVGIYSILTITQMMRQVSLEELTGSVRTIREKTENFLEDISSDLRVLQNSSSVEGWMQGRISQAPASQQRDLAQMGREFLAFARTKGIYYQFRLIDESGDEVFRVECDNPTDSARTFGIASPSELVEGHSRYYFLLIDRLGENQIAFAPAEVVHRGAERIPVMSFALPIFERRHRVGILVANVFEKNLLDVIETRRSTEPGRKIVLVTGDGHYVYHSEKKRDWNRLLASREEDNLQRDYPSAVASAILSGSEGTLAESTNEIISYAPLFKSNPSMSSAGNSLSFSVLVTVFVSVPESVVMGPVRSYAMTLLGFLALFLGSAIGLGLLATRQFTKPISQLQRGAEIVAEGHYEHRLEVKTHDEIEQLAHQFNRMATSLQAHDQELRAHRTHLEDMVLQRTRELLEEKTKLQLLLDNVPSAFVLLDPQYRILTVSAAFTRVTGLPLGEAVGKPYDEVDEFGVDGLWTTAATEGLNETHTRQIHHPDLGDRTLEYVAVPMKEGDHMTALLLIITDVTERKRLEQQWVQTEKLVAAGEMSSMIAHEFRNALTSVKMIVQLFAESKRFRKSEKKSLGVALDSIRHMESVVSELLSFARPKPLQFKPTDANRVLRDSLDFIKPHALRKNISLVSKLDPDIGELNLDESLFKEAVINVLLNGIQAIEACGDREKRGKVRATSRCVRLDVPLTASVYPGSPDQTSVPEIVLPRNGECIRIDISDNGCGISEVQLKKIFDPFYTTKANGTGLGLPMVQRTVVAHAGVVKVESTPKKGTTFSIYLPIPYDQKKQGHTIHSYRG
jgi:PAS domain S-box-containing protein